jgi:modulator of FtsH protease HflK
MADDSPVRNEIGPPKTPLDAGSQALSEALRSSFGIVKVLMAVLVGIFVCSGIFKLGPDERAIKLRLGRPVGQGEKALLGPGGLHFSLPYPIEEAVKVSVTGIKKVTSTTGWYLTTPEQELTGTEPPAGGTLNPVVDGYVLTADNNIVHALATLSYHVADPVAYVFNFVNASNALQSALDDALLQTASQFKVDDILYNDVTGFKEAVRGRVTRLIDSQELGVVVEDCLVEGRPPRQLKEAFANVLKAEVARGKVLNEARSYENQVLSKASADAQSLVDAAKSQKSRLVNDVSSQADRFADLLPKYRANPALFVQQRLTETLGRVFTNAQDKIFVTESAPGQPKELRYQFNREFPKPKTEETKP